MTWVKICGTTSLRDAQLSVAAGADALGFIFASSPRRIEVEIATEIIAALSGQAEMIGVFVNETPQLVAEVAQQVGLTGVQLYGDEPVDSLRNFRRVLGDRKLIKVLHPRELQDGYGRLATYLAARDSIDAILLDSGSPERGGGTGTAYDWNQALPIAEKLREALPLIIAGGLNSHNVVEAIDLFDPWGVDVASGVEAAPGQKHEAKLRNFIAAVRQATATVRQKE